ncbi:MAG: NTP transferase domain-containing protein [Bacteroidales bacterium]|nr:NTP transferase domain-containing protein [Bacteroidales bacterium]MBQ5540758.1 NTP transferase domain-containing protein [Bacteroidales bacterium]
MKPTLVVLAAGMGSRYGGLKQIDKLGPSGQAILQYSCFDAARAGFGKVVFVIRRDIERDFKEVIISKVSKSIPCEYCFQDKDDLPAGFSLPADREKPWGTAHAVLAARKNVTEPFAVINADDFYGKEAYQTIADYFKTLPKDSNNQYCMVGYPVKNTLSEYGTVSRGICNTDSQGNLTTVVERTKIIRENGKIVFIEDDQKTEIAENTPVSMNFWGFTPSFFKYLEDYFKEFLHENINKPKAEFLIPWVVDQLIKNKAAQTKVLTSDAQWFGVTYKEDRPAVVQKFQDLTDKGEYPADF